MLQHVFERSKLYKNWTYLAIATCDKKFMIFQKKIDIHQFKPQTNIPDV